MLCMVAPVVCEGTDGEAEGSITVSIQPHGGVLHAVYLEYHVTQDLTNVVVTAHGAADVAALDVDEDDDGWYLPRIPVCSSTGAALTYDGTEPVAEPVPVTTSMTVGVSTSNAVDGGPSVTAHLYIKPDVRR
jgi:hypothetical protein